MQRFLAPLPAQYDIGQLRAAVIAQWPAVVDVNVVTTNAPNAAAYVPDGLNVPAATLTQFASLVAAHEPVADVTGPNTVTLQQRAQAALQANATFLALTSPTAAQNAAQVQRLTKETNALIRLLLGAVTDISDT